ncbi:hypothetical protein CCR75_002600 [Bremia lactucae]|uniref:Uncharacterized protein n=1 Tax=Bremia lactucae TaxID=4779 RepID=A0A976ILE6_BRELC|nr:hypothetical protein CCR75_002600 [Bremia lactucae]
MCHYVSASANVAKKLTLNLYFDAFIPVPRHSVDADLPNEDTHECEGVLSSRKTCDDGMASDQENSVVVDEDYNDLFLQAAGSMYKYGVRVLAEDVAKSVDLRSL